MEPVAQLLKGRALLPPSPVHLDAGRQANGDIRIHWIRRSRQGWGWVDGVDAPLGEEREAYRLELGFEGGAARSLELTEPEFTYALNDQIADGGPESVLHISVAQISAGAGPGVATSMQFFP